MRDTGVFGYKMRSVTRAMYFHSSDGSKFAELMFFANNESKRIEVGGGVDGGHTVGTRGGQHGGSRTASVQQSRGDDRR